MILQFFKNLIFGLIVSLACFGTAQAQTTAFTYQGKLTDNNLAANGAYQMQFALFDAASGGTQIGSTVTNSAVQITNGIFTVNLDFGANAFPGASRFLQISVFSPATNAFVTLTPRQQFTSAPYAIKSLNAVTADVATNTNNLGGIPANQFVQTNDLRLNDSRDPNAGSGNYVQNRTTEQASTNFNISGNGTAGGILMGNVVSAATQFNIGLSRVLSNYGTNNLFAGFGAGAANTGTNNSFFGRSAGFDNSTGFQNSFFGSFAGANNTTGAENSFFGSGAGDTNTAGNLNSFFGKSAGGANTTGSSNTFIGRESGLANTTGYFNTFVGRNAGGANTTGFQNTFFGANAGSANTVGNNNTFIGFDSGNINGVCIQNNNTLIGYNTNVTCSSFNTVSNSVVIGAGATVGKSDTIVLGISSTEVLIPGTVNKLKVSDYVETDRLYVDTLPGGGGTDICIRTSDRVISQCSSSIRYKDNVTSFNSGLGLVNRLRPVSFNWKSDGSLDLGLVAEEVAEVEPLLATYKDGRVEGVKYDRIGVVLLNAVKEQQTEIEKLKQQIELLKTLVCQNNSQAPVCQ